MSRPRSAVLLVCLTIPCVASATTPISQTLHRITEIEDHRDHQDPFLDQALSHRSPWVLEKALLAIGRIGHPAWLQAATDALSHRSSRVRSAAAFATGLIGGEGAETALRQRLPLESRSKVRRELLMALGRVGGEQTVGVVAEFLDDRSMTIRAAAAQALGLLFNKSQSSAWAPMPHVEAGLVQHASGYGRVGLSAAFALSRYRMPVGDVDEATYLEALRGARNPEAQALLWRRVSRYNSDAVAQALSQHIGGASHEGVRVEAARALARQACSSETAPTARLAISDTSAQVVAAALQSISYWGDCARQLQSDIEAHYQRDGAWLPAEALNTLLAILPADEAGPLALDAASSDIPSVAGVAIRSLSSFAGEDYVQRLVELADDGAVFRRRAAVETLAFLDPARATEAMKRVVADALASEDQAPVYFATVAAQNFAYTHLIPELRATYSKPWSEDEYSVKVGVLDAVALLGDASVIDIIDLGLADANTQVIAAANEAHRAIFGHPAVESIPLNHRVSGPTPSAAQLRRAAASVVRVETERGSFILGMVREAALTAHRFVSLVNDGFYDGLTFHRIVPNFVAQGGDPRGDGWGGTGTFMRDEVSRLRHMRGTVGIATSGKDTGGCQLFVNHAPNLHLDGRYTIFARVLFGMDVVDRLEQSDRIVRATVLWP